MDGPEIVSAAASGPQPKVSIRGLSKVFGEGPGATVALENVDLDVGEHSFVTLVGASGCGKSTLLRIIAGLEFHTGGEIVANGKAVTGPGADRAAAGGGLRPRAFLGSDLVHGIGGVGVHAWPPLR